MKMENSCRFETERLSVGNWQTMLSDACTGSESEPEKLGEIVQSILTPSVTATLPPAWQGDYDLARAMQWIKDRDTESINLLAVCKHSAAPIGLMILFELSETAELRLGYMLHESAWSKGYASELVRGIVDWSRDNSIRMLTGGVGRDNPASMRVLEKCGFTADPTTAQSEEQLFSILLN